MSFEKFGWAIQKSLDQFKMFNIISKYFNFFNYKPPAS